MIKKYYEEFKRNAVKKVLDVQSVRSVSQELGINESQIHKWKRAASANGKQSGAEIAEIDALKKRNRELEMEVEILKKAALIFGRGS